MDDYTTLDPQTFWSTFVQSRIIQTKGISPRDKSGAVTHARQTLNAELSAMHLAMCSLRTRYNALSLISALPAEVLARTFYFCAARWLPEKEAEDPLGWIAVTHVCRLWRDVALQFPNLWSDICLALGPQCTKTMIARSKFMPISIDLYVGEVSERNLSQLCEYFLLTRQLSLTGPSGSSTIIKSTIDTFPPPPAILEIMDIGPVNVTSPSDSFELPGAIAGSHSPSLRHLSLRTFWVPWTAPILHNLTYLEMQLPEPRNPPAGGYFGSSWKALFGALKNKPDLESLILKDCYPSGPCEDAGHVVLQLPRLKVLQLRGLSKPCFGIVARLQIPPSCQVELQCRGDADITEILPFLTAHFHAGVNLPPWYSLNIDHLANKFCLNMMREEKKDYNKNKLTDLKISFYRQEESLRVLKPLWQAMPLQTITMLHVWTETIVPASYHDWLDVFGQFKNVERASISCNGSMSFCTALGMATDYTSTAEPENCTQEDLFLGKLETLELLVDFRDWRHDDGGDVDPLHLTRWLTNRKRVQAVPKLAITLECCSIKRSWVQELEKEADVTWNGNEGRCED